MIETIYRQKAFHRLTKSQQKAKLRKDSEYEIAVQNLTVSWKRGEITEEAYRQQKSELWHNYKDWAISQGLYEKFTPEQQLTEAEIHLSEVLDRVNAIRVELKKPKKKLVEEA